MQLKRYRQLQRQGRKQKTTANKDSRRPILRHSIGIRIPGRRLKPEIPVEDKKFTVLGGVHTSSYLQRWMISISRYLQRSQTMLMVYVDTSPSSASLSIQVLNPTRKLPYPARAPRKPAESDRKLLRSLSLTLRGRELPLPTHNPTPKSPPLSPAESNPRLS